LYDSGCAWLSESEPPEAEFASRQGLFSTGSVSGIPHQAQTFERLANDDEWRVIPFPSSQQNPSLPVYGPSFVVFQSTSEEQLASWLFIKWLLSPQNQARLVEVTGSFPLQSAALEHLEPYAGFHPQWAEAVELLPGAQAEPALASWSLVRWALYDASTQLFRYYFVIDQVPSLIGLLDQTANDLNGEFTGGELAP
jgi:multiple sugar transport system substrate-binding protein